jgi:hypothetical protein
MTSASTPTAIARIRMSNSSQVLMNCTWDSAGIPYITSRVRTWNILRSDANSAQSASGRRPCLIAELRQDQQAILTPHCTERVQFTVSGDRMTASAFFIAFYAGERRSSSGA